MFVDVAAIYELEHKDQLPVFNPRDCSYKIQKFFFLSTLEFILG